MGLFRVLLALSVVMSHTIKWEAPLYKGFGGITSVEIFFLISGFYIALILDKTYKSKKLFYINRILRLYPIYLIICVLVLAVASIRSGVSENLFGFPVQVLSISTFSNLTLVGIDWLMFFDTSGSGIHLTSFNFFGTRMRDLLWVPQAWSLGVEISFYLIAPYLCKKSSRTLILIIVTLIGAKVFSHSIGLDYSPWDHRFFPFELPYFLVGILFYRIRKNRTPNKMFEIPLKAIYTILIFAYIGFSILSTKYSLNYYLMIAILLALATVVILFGPNSASDRRFGELSYPIYICHGLVAQIYGFVSTGLNERFTIFRNHEFSILLEVSAVVIFSYLLLQVVKPIELIRARNRNSSLTQNSDSSVSGV